MKKFAFTLIFFVSSTLASFVHGMNNLPATIPTHLVGGVLMPMNYLRYIQVGQDGHKQTALNDQLIDAINNPSECLSVFDKAKIKFYIDSKENLELKKIQKLLDARASANAKTNAGETVLLLACKENRSDIAQLLLDNGCKRTINVPGSRGWTPLHYAAYQSFPENYKAIDLSRSLIKNGATVNVQTHDHETPLIRAIGNRAAQVVQVLIEARASVNGGAENGITPLLTLPFYTRTYIVPIAELLMNNGAAQTINTTDISGKTCLHLAVESNNLPLTKYLLEYNATICPLKPLMLKGNYTKDMLEILFLYGAHIGTFTRLENPWDAFHSREDVLKAWRESISKQREEVIKKHDNEQKQRLKELPLHLASFIGVQALQGLVIDYLRLTFEEAVQENLQAAKERVQEIENRLQKASRPASSTSSAPTVVRSADADNITRHSKDTPEEKHDEHGEIVPAPTQEKIESLD